MENLDSQAVLEQLKRKQIALKSLDQKLAKELTRKQLLEQIYNNASLTQSQSSISNLSQSQLSYQSTSSVNSNFLKKQINKIYQFSQNTNNQINQTGLTHKLIDCTKNTQKQVDYMDQQRKKKYQHFHDVNSFNRTKLPQQATVELYRQDYIRTIKLQQEKEKREHQIMHFLEIKQKARKQQVQRQRLKIREQLLKQQSLRHSNINQSSYKKGANLIIPQNNLLRIERIKALGHLLRQVQGAKRKTNRLLQKTQLFGYS